MSLPIVFYSKILYIPFIIICNAEPRVVQIRIRIHCAKNYKNMGRQPQPQGANSLIYICQMFQLIESPTSEVWSPKMNSDFFNTDTIDRDALLESSSSHWTI